MVLSGIFTLVTTIQKSTRKVWMITRWVYVSHAPMGVDGIKYAIIELKEKINQIWNY